MKDNSLRGKLLEFLMELYPEGADRRTVISVFYQYHHSQDITDVLEYLADKEYIQKKELPHPYKKQEVILWYKILPKGIDLLDGNIPGDPGITVLRGR